MSEQVQPGRIERVDLRTVWPHEAHHFTPWLAENIDLLNEKLPFDIDSTEREASAGRFSVDLVGDAIRERGEPGKVIIENQFGQTNHDHLGKVLTYLAAYEAQAVIWIAEKARPEHAKAIQWLNDKAEVDAYLFQVEAIRIDDSRPAPVFTQLIGPSALSLQAKADRKRDSVRDLEVRAYWTILLARVAEACRSLKAWQGVSIPKGQWASEKVPGADHAYWVLRTTKGETFVDLIVDGASAKEI